MGKRVTESRAIAVPGSFNDQFADADIVIMWATSGISAKFLYRKVGGPAYCTAFRCGHSLRQSVGNNQEVMEHQGGYTPFEADVTRMLLPGKVYVSLFV